MQRRCGLLRGLSWACEHEGSWAGGRATQCMHGNGCNLLVVQYAGLQEGPQRPQQGPACRCCRCCCLPASLPTGPPARRSNCLQEEAQVRRALNLSFASNLVLLVVRVAIAAISGSLSLVVATLDAVLDVVSSGGCVGGSARVCMHACTPMHA
jgi:hypothetical protein